MEYYDVDTVLDDSCITSDSTNTITSPPRTSPQSLTTGDDVELSHINASESVVSSVSRGASAATNSQPWEVEQATEIDNCTSFSLKTFGCKMANGKPCSSLFPVDYYIDTRSQASLLTRQQLDLVLLGSVMSTTAV